MHYVKYTQQAIVSWLPKHGRDSIFHPSKRFSPKQHNHAVALQTSLRYYQGLGNDGIGSATALPNGDDVLQLRNDAFPTTRTAQTTQDRNWRASKFERTEDGPQRARKHKRIAYSNQDWRNISVEDLLEELKNAASELRLRKCDLLARYMISQRGYKPNREMYMSLILANAATEGSASTVRFLLDQMKEAQIKLGTADCLTVLKVLATHPDYVLRTQIILYMERGWHGLTEDTHHLIIAGMLRGLQLEQAVDELESMVRNGIGVATWLYDLTVAVLLNVGELEEALRVLRMRLEHVGPEELTPIWTFMLEAAAESFNYDITQYVWKRCVTPEYINPTSGTCRHVLNLAARKGDINLATDAFRILVKHHDFASLDHYEMLFEAQINAGDIEGALKLLCEMQADEYTPDHASTRPLFIWLMENPTTNPADYFNKVLSKFEVQGLAVPVAAVNVLIEACTVQHKDRWDDAFRMYDRIREVCAQGPNITTFYHMFDLCRSVKSISWPIKLADEYKAMKLKPDAIIYDGIISSALHCRHDLDQILVEYDEMKRLRVRPLQRTLTALYKALRAAHHPRTRDIEDELESSIAPTDMERVRKIGDAVAEAGRAPTPWEDGGDSSIYPPNKVSEMDGFFHEMKNTFVDDLASLSDKDVLDSIFGEAGESKALEQDAAKPNGKPKVD